MISRRRALALLPAFGLLGGGRDLLTEFAPAAHAQDGGPFTERYMQTRFRGGRVSGPVVSRAQLRDVLSEAEGSGVSMRDRELVSALEQFIALCEPDLPMMRGPGGLVTYAMVMAGRAALRGPGPNFSPIRIDVKGKIDRTGRDGQPGFRYDAATGAGHIWNTMTHTFYFANGRKLGSFAYDLKVAGGPGAFRAIERDPSASTAFPGSAIPISQADATDRGFKWKLEATAARGLAVTEVWTSEDEGEFVKLRADEALGCYVFAPRTGVEACVDMMFGYDDGPPATLPADAAPPDYCLGRCASPPIVNTY